MIQLQENLEIWRHGGYFVNKSISILQPSANYKNDSCYRMQYLLRSYQWKFLNVMIQVAYHSIL